MPRNPRSRRVFSYDEALSIFPSVRDITAEAVRQVEEVVNQMNGGEEMESGKEELQAAYERIVQAWTQEITSLGCEVKGLWLVDWDSGDGYYCWKYPEESLGFFHGYEEGFQGRMRVN